MCHTLIPYGELSVGRIPGNVDYASLLLTNFLSSKSNHWQYFHENSWKFTIHVVLILFLFLAGQKTTFCKNGILYSNWCKFNRFDEKKQLYIFSEYLIIGQILSNCSIRFNLFYLHKRNNNSFIKYLMLQKVATKKGWVIWSLLIKRYFDFDLKCPVLEGLFSKEKVTSKL